MIKSLLFFSLVLLGLTQVKVNASENSVNCEELKNSCEYYSCFEANRKCGRFGYSRGFGQKYCLRFDERKTNFSIAGKLWVAKTRYCLIEKLEDNIDARSCRSIKKESFKEHLSCYVESGFCELSKADKKEVYKTIWPGLWRLRTIKAGIKIKKICKALKS
ncbi:MAG: hypothetical protein ACJAT2_000555 [Bacteriovoracaceae bacterium]|jgi:hypothetical protein